MHSCGWESHQLIQAPSPRTTLSTPIAGSPVSCGLWVAGMHCSPLQVGAWISWWESKLQEHMVYPHGWEPHQLGASSQVQEPAGCWCRGSSGSDAQSRSYFLPCMCSMAGSVIVWTTHQIILCLYLPVWQGPRTLELECVFLFTSGKRASREETMMKNGCMFRNDVQTFSASLVFLLS